MNSRGNMAFACSRTIAKAVGCYPVLAPAELRNMVTSPGGTTAEAIYQMEKDGLRTVLSKAVWAAYQRATALGRRTKE
jgi:pyrroline-5-carboxylate reductase